MTPPRPRLPRRPRLLALATATALLGLVVTGCSGGSQSDGDSSAGSATDSLAGPAPAEQEEAAGGSTADQDLSYRSAARSGQPPAGVEQPRLISTGTVSLRSDDVAAALFAVQEVVDVHRGQVESSETGTDREGEVERARLVVRIPTASFDEAMGDLGGTATLVASSSETEDVTAAVLDTDIRVRVQRASIERIEALLSLATSIGDIVRIESQLSARQADLASLEQQQKSLADQTALSTISVSLERSRGDEPRDDDDTGFAAGLAAGWDGLVTFGTGFATVTGAVLPFLAVLGVLAGLGWPLARRLRRRTTVPAVPQA